MISIVFAFCVSFAMCQDYATQFSGDGTPSILSAPYLSTPSCLLNTFTEELWANIQTGIIRIFYCSPNTYVRINPATHSASFYYDASYNSPANTVSVPFNYNPYTWLHYALTRSTSTYKLYVNTQLVSTWNPVNGICSGKQSYIAICDGSPCSVQLRRYRRWANEFGNLDLINIFASSNTKYGTISSIMHLELNEPSSFHRDISENGNDVDYRGSNIRQMQANLSLINEEGYADSSVAMKFPCNTGNVLKAVFDTDLIAVRINPSVPVEHSFEFWMNMGPLVVSTDLDKNFPIIQSWYYYYTTNPNYNKVNCGIKNRKFSCYYYWQDNIYRTEIQQPDVADIFINKWAYISFQYREVTDTKDNVMLYVLINNEFYSKTTANAVKNLNSVIYFNTGNCGGTSTLYFQFSEVRLWTKIRGKGEILKTMNNELNPLNHRLLGYYSQSTDNRIVYTYGYINFADLSAYASVPMDDMYDPIGNRPANYGIYSTVASLRPFCKFGYDYSKELKKCMKNGKRVAYFNNNKIYEGTFTLLTCPFTFEAWVWAEDTATSIGIFGLSGSTFTEKVEYNADNTFSLISGTSTKSISRLQWFYLQYVYTESSTQCIINSEEYVSITHGAQFTTNPVTYKFGSTFNTVVNLSGILYHIRVWMGSKYEIATKETEPSFPSHYTHLYYHLSMLENELSNGVAYSRVNEIELTLSSPYSLVYLALPFMCADDQYFDGIECKNDFRSLVSLTTPAPYFYFTTYKGFTFIMWVYLMSPTVDLSIVRLSATNWDTAMSYGFATDEYRINWWSWPATAYIRKTPASISTNQWVRIVQTHDYLSTNNYCLYIGDDAVPSCALYGGISSTRTFTFQLYSSNVMAIRSIHLQSFVKSASDVMATGRDRNTFDANLFLSTAYANTNYQTTYGQFMLSNPAILRAGYRTELVSEASNKFPLIVCPAGYYYKLNSCNLLAHYISAFNMIDSSTALELFNILNPIFAYPKEVIGFWICFASTSVPISSTIVDLSNAVNSLFSIYVSATELKFLYNGVSKYNYLMSFSDSQWYQITYAHFKNITAEYTALLINGVMVDCKVVTSVIMLSSTITKAFLPSNTSAPNEKLLFANVDLMEFTNVDDLAYLYQRGMSEIVRTKISVSLCHLSSSAILSASYTKLNGYEYIPLTNLLPTSFSIFYPALQAPLAYFLPIDSTQSFPTKGPISTNFTFDVWVYFDELSTISISVNSIFYIAYNETVRKFYVSKDSSSTPLMYGIPFIKEKVWNYLILINYANKLEFYVNDIYQSYDDNIDTEYITSYIFSIQTTSSLTSVAFPRLWSKSINYRTVMSYKLRTLENLDNTLLMHLIPYTFNALPSNNRVTLVDYSYTTTINKYYSLTVDSINPYSLPLCSFKGYYNGIDCNYPLAFYTRGRDWEPQLFLNSQNFNLAKRLFTLEGWVNFRKDTIDSYTNPIIGLEELSREGFFIYESYSLGIVQLKLRYQYRATTTNNSETMFYTASSNDWHHVAMIVNLTKAYFALNGVIMENITLMDYSAYTFRRTYISIGRDYITGYLTNSLIAVSNVKLWQVPLSASQITSSMNNKLPFKNIAELSSYYDFSIPYDMPFTVEDNGYMTNYKFKLHTRDAIAYNRGIAYIANAINLTLTLPFIECPQYYKLSNITYQCIPNMQANTLNRKSAIITSQSILTIPLQLMSDMKAADFTVEFWIKFITLSSTFIQVITQTPKTTPYFSLQYKLDNLLFSYNNFTTQIGIGDACNFYIYSWSHIALANNASSNTFTIYNNEISCGTLSALAALPIKNIIIFGDTEATTAFKVREFKIWHSVLDQFTLQTNKYGMNDGTGTIGLILYYRFNEGTGTQIYEILSTQQSIQTYNLQITTPLFEPQLWTDDWDISICDSNNVFDPIQQVCAPKKVPILYFPYTYSFAMTKEYNTEFTIELWIKHFLTIEPSQCTVVHQTNHFAINKKNSNMCGIIYSKENTPTELCIMDNSIEEGEWAHFALSINGLGLPEIAEYNGASEISNDAIQLGNYISNYIIVGGECTIAVKNIKVWSKIMSTSELFSRRYYIPNRYEKYLLHFIPMHNDSTGMITDMATTVKQSYPSQYYCDYYDTTKEFGKKWVYSAAQSTTDVNIENLQFRFTHFAFDLWVKLLQSSVVSIFDIMDLSPTLVAELTFDTTLKFILNGTNYSSGNLPSPTNKWIFAHFNFGNQVKIYTSLNTYAQMGYLLPNYSDDLTSAAMILKADSFLIKNVRFYSTPPDYNQVTINYMTEIDIRSNILNTAFIIPFNLQLDSSSVKLYPIIEYYSINAQIQDGINNINIISENITDFQAYWVNDAHYICPIGSFYNKKCSCISGESYLLFKKGKTTQISLPAITFGVNPYSIEFWINLFGNSDATSQIILKFGQIVISYENCKLCWSEGSAKQCALTSPLNNSWTHVSIANGDEDIPLYKISYDALNVSAAGAFVEGTDGLNTVQIGDSTNSFDGSICHLQLWNQYNSDGYIKFHMHIKNIQANSIKLAAYYPLSYIDETYMSDLVSINTSAAITGVTPPNWISLVGPTICEYNFTYDSDTNSCIIQSQYKNSVLFDGSDLNVSFPIGIETTSLSDITFSFWMNAISLDSVTFNIIGVILKEIKTSPYESRTLYITNISQSKHINTTLIVPSKWVYTHMAIGSSGAISESIYTMNREIRNYYTTTIPSSNLHSKINSIRLTSSGFTGYIKYLVARSQYLEFNSHTINWIFIHPMLSLPNLILFFPLNETIGTTVYDISMRGNSNGVTISDIEWKSSEMEKCFLEWEIRIENEWQFIIVEYNRDIEYSTATADNNTTLLCSQIFDAGTAAKLNNSKCSLELNIITIEINIDSTIKSGDALEFGDRSILCSVECDCRCLNSFDAPLVVPNTLDIPTAVVKYPTKIDYCIPFAIDVYSITGVCRRYPKIQYDCISATNLPTEPASPTFNCSAIDSYFSTLTTNSTTAIVPSDVTIPNGLYMISVKVLNILGRFSTYSLNIETSSSHTLSVKILGSSGSVDVLSYENVILQVLISKPDCQGVTTETFGPIEWKVILPASQSTLEDLLHDNFTSNYSLSIPSGYLKESTSYKLMALYENANDTIIINVKEAPIIPVANLNYISICINQSAVLSFAQSFDLNTKLTTGINFLWNCTDIETQSSCTFSNGSTVPQYTTPDVILNENTFIPNAMQLWAVKLSATFKSSAYYSNITVYYYSQCISKSITLEIYPYKNKYLYSTNERIPVLSNITSVLNESCTISYNWVINEQQLTNQLYETDIIHSNIINIRPNAYQCGLLVVNLTATATCGTDSYIGVAAINISILCGPSGGLVSFNAPSPTYEYVDQISMVFYDWKDSYGPLSYKVEYRLLGSPDDFVAVAPSSKLNEIKFALSTIGDDSSNTYELRGSICNSFGVCTTVNDQITIDKDISPLTLDDALDIALLENESRKRPYHYREICKSLSNEDVQLNTTLLGRIIDETLSSMTSDSGEVQISSDASARILALNYITNYTMDLSSYMESMLDLMLPISSYIDRDSNKNLATSEILSTNDYLKMLSICSNLTKFTLTSEAKQKLDNIISAVTKGILSDQYTLLQNQNINLKIDKHEIDIAKITPTTAPITILKPNGNSITFNNISALTGGLSSAILEVHSIHTPSLSSNILRKLSYAGASFKIDVKNSSNFSQVLPVSSILQDVFSITVPIVPVADKEYRCAYYDSTNAIYIYSNGTIASNQITCNYNHFSEFSITTIPKPTTQILASMPALNVNLAQVILPSMDLSDILASPFVNKPSIVAIYEYIYIPVYESKGISVT